MARVLVSSFGSYGDVHPALGLAVALRGRGHEPVLALPEFYRADVEGAGLELRPVRPDLDLRDRAAVARVMHPVTGARYLFARVIAPAVRDSYHDLHAASADVDLIVAHPAAPAGPIVAHVRGLPWVSVVLAPVSFFSHHDPAVPPPPVPAWRRRHPPADPLGQGEPGAAVAGFELNLHANPRSARAMQALERLRP